MQQLSQWFFNDVDFMRWENPWLLGLLILGLLFPVILIWFRVQTLKKLHQWFVAKNIPLMFPGLSFSRYTYRLLLGTVAFILVILASANLQLGSQKKQLEQEGIDIIFCLDVSSSMLAEDIVPNRLDRAKNALLKLVDNLGSDRVGIVVFAGNAYLQLPLTSDHSAIAMYLKNISTEMIPVGGTSIATALKKAQDAFPEKIETSRAIILISDGEDHEDAAIEMAKTLNKKGISIHTVGVGSAEGVMIPHYVNGKKRGWKKDAQGSTVVTRLNETILQEIAAAAGGTYIKASNQSLGLDLVLNAIQAMEKSKFGTSAYLAYDSYYHWFLVPAIVLLCFEELIFARRWKKQ